MGDNVRSVLDEGLYSVDKVVINVLQAGRRRRSPRLAQISLPRQQGSAAQHFDWFH